jgi:N-dimethylarginine dimethylaminohydrolase
MESNMEVLQKTKNRTTIQSSNTIPGHMSRGMCSRIRQNQLHTHVYCSTIYNNQALETFQICPMTDEWIKKMWYIYTMEFYSVLKKNEIMLFACTWVELENIKLNEVSQAQKVKGHMFSLICES